MSGEANAPERARAEIRAFWDREGARYDGRDEHGVFSDAERTLWTRALEVIPAGARVLDVGTGTGFLAMLLAELGHRVTGVDASTEMMAVARAKSAERGLGIAYEHGSTEELPFPDGTFDGLTARHVIWTLLEPDRIFAEWHRVLVPDGTVVVDCSLDPAVAGYHYGDETVDVLPFRAITTPEPVVDALRAAGFTDVGAEDTETDDMPRAMVRARAAAVR